MYYTYLLFCFFVLTSYVYAYEGNPDNELNDTESAVYHICTTPGMISLTYDDGPNTFTEQFIRNISSDYRVTFFVNGWNYQNVQEAPWHNIIKLAYDKGHEIGNHGWNHWSYINASHMNDNKVKWNLNETQILEQLTNVNDLIYKIIGKAPAIFRPPYGQFNEDTLRIASHAGLNYMALWNIDSLDWELNDTPGVFKAIIDTVMAPGISPQNSSFVVVMHEQIKSSMLVTTPVLYTLMTAMGYKFVTFSECIGVEPYQQNYTPTKDFELMNGCYQKNSFLIMLFLIMTFSLFLL
jgi:peptidoglycan/xylan/chitin deacetylase (PgdA/CDA1 family)